MLFRIEMRCQNAMGYLFDYGICNKSSRHRFIEKNATINLSNWAVFDLILVKTRSNSVNHSSSYVARSLIKLPCTNQRIAYGPVNSR